MRSNFITSQKISRRLLIVYVFFFIIVLQNQLKKSNKSTFCQHYEINPFTSNTFEVRFKKKALPNISLKIVLNQSDSRMSWFFKYWEVTKTTFCFLSYQCVSLYDNKRITFDRFRALKKANLCLLTENSENPAFTAV